MKNNRYKTFIASLMAMIGMGNKAYATAKAKLLDIPYVPGLKTRKKPAHGYYTRSHMHRAIPNPKRRATKTLNGEIRHLGHTRGAFIRNVPTLDQTKALEQRIGLKVRVKGGKCHVGNSGLIMPVNITLDEATALLDAHLA